jgi:hypothetical protein
VGRPAPHIVLSQSGMTSPELHYFAQYSVGTAREVARSLSLEILVPSLLVGRTVRYWSARIAPSIALEVSLHSVFG